MENNENNIRFFEGIKIILISLVALLVIATPIILLCKWIFNLPLLFGTIIAILIMVLVIIFTGAWKPATANENTDNDEDDD